jgi:lipopolysaccharide biosynthesis regulator YciM
LSFFKNLFSQKQASAQSIEADEVCKKATSLMNNSPDEAIVLLEQAIKIAPKHMDSYANLVYIYRQVKVNPNKAIQVGLEALKIDKKHPVLIEQIGKAYIEAGKFDEALNIFTSLKPEQASIDTLGYLTYMYIAMEQQEKAGKTAQLFAKQVPNQSMAEHVRGQIIHAFVLRRK